jgi:purine-binding chemotaxis protein CheW
MKRCDEPSSAIAHGADAAGGLDRLLTFEVGDAMYALPIASVREVAEVGDTACIPTLAPEVGGVINHHGDALPVFRRSALLDLREAELPPPEHVLVVSDPATGAARLGLPVDRVLGLVDGAGRGAPGEGAVAERRPIDGRIANVLDPRRLVARAREVIERSPERRD